MCGFNWIQNWVKSSLRSKTLHFLIYTRIASCHLGKLENWTSISKTRQKMNFWLSGYICGWVQGAGVVLREYSLPLRGIFLNLFLNIKRANFWWHAINFGNMFKSYIEEILWGAQKCDYSSVIISSLPSPHWTSAKFPPYTLPLTSPLFNNKIPWRSEPFGELPCAH